MSGQKNYPDRSTDRRIVSTGSEQSALGGLDKNNLRGLWRQVDFDKTEELSARNLLVSTVHRPRIGTVKAIIPTL